jgi:hypothetical protein
LLDYAKVIKDVSEKTTIEDSVEVLLLRIANEILAHPGDDKQNVDLAAGLVEHILSFGTAVADNVVTDTLAATHH